MPSNNETETGCVVDDVLGMYTAQRVCLYATLLGWDGRIPTDEEVQSDFEGVLELTDEATDWLNANVAKEGHTYEWYEGAFFYLSNDEWNQMV